MSRRTFEFVIPCIFLSYFSISFLRTGSDSKTGNYGVRGLAPSVITGEMPDDVVKDRT
jgi:hypothetical protein